MQDGSMKEFVEEKLKPKNKFNRFINQNPQAQFLK